MSLQDLLEGLNQLQEDGDVRGALNHLINSNLGQGIAWQPCVDIIDTKDNLYLYIELPGVSENSIDVDFFNNKVTISGEKLKCYNTAPYKKEIVYGEFKRTLTIPISVTKQDNVSVKYTNGVLTVDINKKKENENRFSVRVTNEKSSTLNVSVD